MSRIARALAAVTALLAAACDEPPPPPSADMGAAHDLAAPEDALLPADLKPAGGGGHLRVIVLDDDEGLPMPARVIVTAVAPTPAVRFDVSPTTKKPTEGATGVRLGPGVIGAPEGVLLIGGDGVIEIPPGTYDLFISRGPEWEAHEQRLTTRDGENATVQASLRRSVDTRGWLAADTHVHSVHSYDSKLGVEDRVVSEVAVGVELILATEHNVLADFQPDVENLGYARLARAIVCDEFNFLEGHGGAYPMPYLAGEPFGGTVKLGLDWDTVKSITAEKMFERLRAYDTHPAITINHPRMYPDLGYFINLKQYGADGWAPPKPLPTAGKFDGLEIMNGYMHNPSDVAAMMRDWFFILSSGARLTAVGGSDTHRLNDSRAGFPRTWLRVPTEDVTLIQGKDVADAIKGQRAIASNGPFPLLTVAGAGIGEQVTVMGGKALVEITVDAPDWIDLTKVVLWQNGKKAREWSVKRGSRPAFTTSLEQSLPAGDSWLLVQAHGDKPLPVALIGEHQNGEVRPMAFTNAVFVDGDGDGKWSPRISDPDPGPIPPPWKPPAGGPRPHHHDCEPPLWTDPARWATP